MLSSDSPAKTTKTSINIAFLSPFHVKHRLKSHISTSLNPSALPHDRRHQTTKHIGQCKHASFILPRSILRRFTQSAPLSAISRRFGHIARSHAIHDCGKHSLRNAAQPPKHLFNIRACARAIAPPTMQSTHSQLTAPPTHSFML